LYCGTAAAAAVQSDTFTHHHGRLGKDELLAVNCQQCKWHRWQVKQSSWSNHVDAQSTALADTDSDYTFL